MHHHYPFAVLLCAAALVATPVVAEETVVVTATRTSLTIDDALAPVIVISGDELRRTATIDIADALRLYAGIEIGRNGGPGQATSVFIRGTNSNHTQVLVDGVRINPGTLGGAALQNIRPQDIARIEVVKGPRSSLYGTEAIGGVVNIITRRAEQPFQADAEVAAGRFGTRAVGGGLAGRQGVWYAGVRGDHLTTGGFPPQAGTAIDRGHDNTTLGAHAGWEDAGYRLELRHRDARGNTEYLDFFGAPVDQDFTNAVSALEYAVPLGDAVRSTLRFARAVDEIHQQQSPDYAETRRTSIDWQLDWTPAAAHAFNLGLHRARENTRAEVFGGAFDERPETRAVFGQYQRHGARTQQLVAARHSDHDAFGGHWIWNAEQAWRFGDDWRLVAGAGTAFRAPDSTQRFGFGGDPGLRPERSRNFELGLRGRLSEHRRVEWQVFENRIDDLITFDLATFTLANIDRARIQGTELAFTHARDRWYWRQSLVLQRPRDLATGDPLPRRARRSLQTALRYDAGRAVFGLDLLATGPRKDSGFSDDYIGGYVLVNLSAQWEVTRNWTIDARLENAFDKRYETALGFPMSGRALFVRAQWQH